LSFAPENGAQLNFVVTWCKLQNAVLLSSYCPCSNTTITSIGSGSTTPTTLALARSHNISHVLTYSFSLINIFTQHFSLIGHTLSGSM
jgi:hypothetical protein